MSFQDTNIGNCTRNNGVLTNGYVRKKRRGYKERKKEKRISKC